MLPKGTPLVLDPAGALFAAIGAGTCGPTSRARTTWATRG
jgi:hypothetical protein